MNRFLSIYEISAWNCSTCQSDSIEDYDLDMFKPFYSSTDTIAQTQIIEKERPSAVMSRGTPASTAWSFSTSEYAFSRSLDNVNYIPSSINNDQGLTSVVNPHAVTDALRGVWVSYRYRVAVQKSRVTVFHRYHRHIWPTAARFLWQPGFRIYASASPYLTHESVECGITTHTLLQKRMSDTSVSFNVVAHGILPTPLFDACIDGCPDVVTTDCNTTQPHQYVILEIPSDSYYATNAPPVPPAPPFFPLPPFN
jgi:hypothetical protein